MLDEACFVFGDAMDKGTFQELANDLMQLYDEREYAAALMLVEQNAPSFLEHSARITFWRMCLLSLNGRIEETISVLKTGLEAGLWWSENHLRDPDLDAVREAPEFKHLAALSHERYLVERTRIQPDRAVLIPDRTSKEMPLLIALHGRNGNKDQNLEHWEAARQRGWLVISPQSTQPLYPGSYCWDDSEQSLENILFHFEAVTGMYRIDRTRIVIGGFSQGSGMAVYAALDGRINMRGFIGIGTFIAEPDSLIPLAHRARNVRGYFITGEKDHTLDTARAVQAILKDNKIQFEEEIHPGLGHEFPVHFDQSFESALKFILET